MKERDPEDPLTKNRISRRDIFKLVLPFLSGLAGGVVLEDNNVFHRINIWEHSMPIPDPNSDRFLIIADVHAGNIDSGRRQNNSRSIGTLQNVIDHIKDYPFIRAFQMGDLIRQQKSENQNIANYQEGLEILEQLPFPTTHLLGNHDVWGISPENLDIINRNYNLGPFFGVEKYKDFQIVWLDLTAPKEMPGTLPEERIDWLKNNVIFKDTPTIILSHYALLPQDSEGSFYFEENPRLTFLTNGPKVWESLKDLPIHAVLSAHMHWISHSLVGQTHMITVPAFVENMLSSDSGENPGVYSILEINYPKKFVLKSYFGSICFSRIQT